MKQSQKQWVESKLKEEGLITRNQCLQHFITRLSAIMLNLKNEEWKFEARHRGGDYEYHLLKGVRQPFMPRYEFIPSEGVMVQKEIDYSPKQ